MKLENMIKQFELRLKLNNLICSFNLDMLEKAKNAKILAEIKSILISKEF